MNVFELQARIGLDDSEYNSKLDKAGSTMNKLAKAIGNGLKTVAKVGVAAVSAGAAALTALGTASIEQYAEYEQLVGGVETLFKSSADAVMDYANNAFKTAGLSASEYMNTVTSFSASLISSLGGDTALAADVANRAITDMSDNANKMGTDMSMIQNAYQGFAKQNYTMLDNLKLGYGGTQEEMKRLIKDASQLTDVQKELGITVDESSMSFGNIVNAISVVQKNMGIMGTTAAEAERTISGSVFMMKSAWYNLVTGFADGNQDIGQLMDNFMYSVDKVADNVVPRIKEMLPRLIDGIGYLIDELGPEAEGLIQDLLPSLISGAGKLVVNLISRIPQIISGFGTSVKDALVQSLNEAGMEESAKTVETVFDGLISAANGTAEAIESAFEKIGPTIEWVSEKINPAIDWITGNLANLKTAMDESGAGADDWKVAWEATMYDTRRIAESEGVPGIIAFFDALSHTSEEAIKYAESQLEISNSAGETAANVDAATSAVQNFNTETANTSSNIDGMSESAQNFANTVGEALIQSAAGFTDLDSNASQTWSNMIVTMGEQWNTFTTQMGTSFQQFSETVNTSDMWSNFSSNMASLRDDATQTMNEVVAAVEGMVAKCKAAMNFSWSLPYLAMPHINISGSFSIDPPSAPSFSVSWYSKAMNNAMILNGATIFGAMGGKLLGGGEAGKEVVSGADTLMRMIKDAVREVTSEPVMTSGRNTSGIQIIQNIQTVPQTPVELASATRSYFEQARWAI